MIAKNLKKKVRQGTVFYELKDISAAEWNEKAVLQRKKIFLKMFGFDPESDKEAREGIDRYLKR
nr:hypothetical protein [uncultured Trichococcus sp.]